MRDRQVSLRIDAATRATLDAAAAAADIGISTLLSSIVGEWAKAERRRQIREAVAAIVAGPTKGELVDDPADWCPAVVEFLSSEQRTSG